MKLFFTVVAVLSLSFQAMSQSQGTALRSTNGVSFGRLTVQDHIAATNTGRTNIIAGRVQGQGSVAASAGGWAVGLNVRAGSYSLITGSGTSSSAVGALGGGQSNIISSSAPYSLVGGVRNIVSGTANLVSGTDVTVDGENSSASGTNIVMSSLADNTHVFGRNINLDSANSNCFVFNADADIFSNPGVSNAVLMNAEGGFYFTGGPIIGDGSGLTNSPSSIEVNVADFGTYADYFQSTGSMAASSLLLTGTVAFVSADVGKIVAVFGAGPSTSDLVTEIVSVSSGVATLALASTLAVTNAKTSYGHDDSTNIQAAIDYALSVGKGGFLPTGNYLIIQTNWSTAASTAEIDACLLIRSNNFVLRGEGPYKSVLCNLGAYRLLGGAVQRGYGIRATGVSPAQSGVIEIRDLGLYGGVNGFTGNGAFPADPADGDGWDVTHKGLILGTTVSVDRVLLSDCHFYGWRGETIYQNSDAHTSVGIDDSVFDGSNGNLFNPSASVRVRNTVFLNAINGVEMTQGVSHEGISFVNCTFSNLSGGININGGLSNAIHPVLISGNYFTDCTNGIVGDVMHHVIAVNNVFSDTQNPIIASSAGGGGNWDVTISGNTFLSRAYNCIGVSLFGGCYNFNIFGNTFLQGTGTVMYAGVYYGDLENVLFTGNTMHCTRAFIPASTITGHNPLLLDNLYDVSEMNEIDQTVGAGPITVIYTGEVKGLQSFTNSLHDVLIETNLVPDGALMTLIDASDRTTAALVWRITNSATVKVSGTRYLRLAGDQLTMRFNADLAVWEEQSYANPLWAYSLIAPTVGVWDAGDRISTGTNGWLVCIVAGTPGTWRTNYLDTLSVNGNVGIGTTSPGSKLQIDTGGNRAVNFWTISGYNVLSMNGDLTASGHTGFLGGGSGDDSLYMDVGGTGDLIFRTGGSTQKAVLLSNGNLGIGLAAPTNALQVIGAVQATTTVFANVASLTNGILWQGGAQLTNVYVATATLDFGNVATIGCGDLTITVTGAALGDVVDLGVPNASVVANSSYSAWVSAADTVTVRFCALISGDPASGVFRAEVHKWK